MRTHHTIILGVFGLITAALTTTVAGQALMAITTAKVLDWLYPDAWYNPWTWLEVMGGLW